MHVIRKQLGKNECNGKITSILINTVLCWTDTPNKEDYF